MDLTLPTDILLELVPYDFHCLKLLLCNKELNRKIKSYSLRHWLFIYEQTYGHEYLLKYTKVTSKSMKFEFYTKKYGHTTNLHKIGDVILQSYISEMYDNRTIKYSSCRSNWKL